MRELRLLLISPLPPPPGGIATWTRILLRELAHSPEVEIVHQDTAVRWRQVTNISAPARIVGGAWQALRDYRRFCRLTTRVQPGVVHLCTSAGFSLFKDRLVLRRCRTLGIPAVVHYRFGRIPSLHQADGWEWRLLMQCTALAAVSLVLDTASLRSLQQTRPDTDVRVMPNMVDLDAVDAALAAARVGPRIENKLAGLHVTYAGHVLPAKGVTDLVTACARVEQEVVLDLVGPAEERYRRELESLCGQHLRLRFRGTLSHEATLARIAASDVFTLPSRSEGFPNVVAEAMACSRPVLATRVGAMPDMLDATGSEPCGLCVEPGQPEDLAQALRWMVTHPKERCSMGIRGRQRVESEYAAPVVTRRLVELWQELVRES